MRVRVMAVGWPGLHPLPLGLILAASMARVSTAATHTDANASVISKRVTSSTSGPARCSALGPALIGVSPVLTGATPTDAQLRVVAKTSSPSPATRSEEAMTMAPAASSGEAPTRCPTRIRWPVHSRERRSELSSALFARRRVRHVDQLVAVAQEAGVSLVTLSVGWVLANKAISAPIVGASPPDQLVQSLEAAEFVLDDELKSRLDALTHEHRMGDAAR